MTDVRKLQTLTILSVQNLKTYVDFKIKAICLSLRMNRTNVKCFLISGYPRNMRLPV